MAVENTLAYYDMATNFAAKSFITQALGIFTIKLFSTLINSKA
jgi:hypothetical protein